MAKTPSWRVTEAQKNYARWHAYILLAMFIYIIGYSLIAPAGNPITKLKVEKAAEEYLQANHPQVFRQGRRWKHDTYYYETEDGKWWEYRFYGNYTDDDSINGSPQLCFSLLYDGEANLAADGYTGYYLKGGEVYRNASWEFYKAVADAFTPRKGDSLQGVELEYVWFDDSSFYSMDDYDSPVYRRTGYDGPYYDPEKDHDFMALAADHGRADIYLRTKAAVDTDTYCRMAEEILNMLAEGGIKYNTARIYLYSSRGENSTYETLLDYTAACSENLLQTVKDHTAINTASGLIRF
ncbi:MAG: hypothetical protein II977_04335 [Oscillospiraceae bacterium]|nr:hypothetical protein [Oscillospiraceae bacterium]